MFIMIKRSKDGLIIRGLIEDETIADCRLRIADFVYDIWSLILIATEIRFDLWNRYFWVMKVRNWIPVLFIGLLVVSCFLPWITIVSKGIVVSGFESQGTNFGKPGLLHIILIFFVLVFVCIPTNWSKNVAFFISALNIAWAIRNYMIISACYAGLCPVKHSGLYLLLISSLLITASILIAENKKS